MYAPSLFPHYASICTKSLRKKHRYHLMPCGKLVITSSLLDPNDHHPIEQAHQVACRLGQGVLFFSHA